MNRIDHLHHTVELIKKFNFNAFKVHTILSEKICSCGAYNCSSPGKHPTFKDWKNGPFFSQFHQFVIRRGEKDILSNIGIKTGNGIIVIDFDSNEAYEYFISCYPECKLTLTSKTGKGFHVYLSTIEKLSNKVRIFKDTDIRAEGGYVLAPGSNHVNGYDYKWIDPNAPIINLPQELLKNLLSGNSERTTNHSSQVMEGGRNNFIFKETIKFSKLGFSLPAIKVFAENLNSLICTPPLDEDEVDKICDNVFAKQTKNSLPPSFPISALNGVLGELISKVAPYTEASPVAIYSQMLTIIGCYFGRCTYSEVSGDRHYPNLMTLIVGDSAIARKGTSLGVAVSILKQIIPEFIEQNFKSGATSAEGIIYHNRDPRFEVKEKKGVLEKICIDAGVTDKRLMIVESEFGSVLISMKREGNKLSTTIRDAYDSKNLSTLSKNDSVKSTEPHISIVAHITEEELKHLLNSVDVFNGFGNRFMFVYTKTDKILPEAPSINDLEIKSEIQELRKVLMAWDNDLNSIAPNRISFSKSAQALWNQRYIDFMENPPKEIAGVLLNRNLTHVKKLSIVIAMLDLKKVIERHHLEAAFAVGDYSAQSVEFIFRNTTSHLGHKHKNIVQLLESKLTGQASRSEISKEALGKNSTKEEIESIKNKLIDEGIIAVEKNSNVEVWSLKGVLE